MPEPVEVDRLKLVLEDLDVLLLGEPNKLWRKFGDLRGNLTLYVLFLFTSLCPRPLGLTFTAGRRRSSCSNLGIRLPPKAFQLELRPCLYGVSFRLSLLEVDLGLQ